MDSLEFQGIDALDRFVIGLTRHPAKRFVRAAIRQHDVVVVPRDARDQRNRGGKIFYFRRHREGRIDQH